MTPAQCRREIFELQRSIGRTHTATRIHQFIEGEPCRRGCTGRAKERKQGRQNCGPGKGRLWLGGGRCTFCQFAQFHTPSSKKKLQALRCANWSLKGVATKGNLCHIPRQKSGRKPDSRWTSPSKLPAFRGKTAVACRRGAVRSTFGRRGRGRAAAPALRAAGAQTGPA